MKSSNSSFESILEALIEQKQLLEDMQAENETLRQQLADLKAGHGVFIEIQGTRIPLAGAPDTHVFDVASDGDTPSLFAIEETAPVPIVTAAGEKDAALQETRAISLVEPDPALQQTTAIASPTSDLTLQPTASISSETLQGAERETPQPGADFVIEDVLENAVPLPASSSSNFLEDALLAEFSTASTRHVGNWSGPITNSPLSHGPITNNPDLNEEEKAALRRALSGSYILE
ncbi:MAG TPA: hypothetical protein VGN15_02465 [Ktedonobacteraceae bacterium]|nr:hypothetical protein [Ktedonobacteraceae bacterium]